MTFGSIGGPAIGSIILAAWGTPWAHGLTPSPTGQCAHLFLRMAALTQGTSAERPSLRRIREGTVLRESRRDPVGTYLIDFAAMFLAFPYAPFPFVADELNAPVPSVGWWPPAPGGAPAAAVGQSQ